MLLCLADGAEGEKSSAAWLNALTTKKVEMTSAALLMPYLRPLSLPAPDFSKSNGYPSFGPRSFRSAEGSGCNPAVGPALRGWRGIDGASLYIARR
ncbi:MAG: hypothetical protein H5T86_01470 [Armatimonadetes bacterium]|nr:hypothetical protein [Armatimonadota bacterium]